MSARKVIAFLGPSLPAREVASRDVDIRPPARKGDVLAALEDSPAAIALVDGVFEASPSVWHRELIAAIESGVAVFGGASMGALRAAELDGEGMIGVGDIYRGYRDGQLVDDSEVALLHADAEHGFRPLTLPLVNVRHAVHLARRARAIAPRDAEALISAAVSCFYGERTWPVLFERAGWSEAARAQWKAFAQGGLEDLKAVDARACIDAAVAYVRSGGKVPARAPAPDSSWLRWLGLSATDARTPEGEAVLVRKTLAGMARAFGLDAASPPPNVEGPAHVRARVAEEHLAQLALDAAVRLLPDGPSRAEAEATARREAAPGRRGKRR